MKFVIKLFPEITIKSTPVRKRFIKQLRRNIRWILKRIDADIEVSGAWDKIEVNSSADGAVGSQIVEALGRIPGIGYFMEVAEYPVQDLDHITSKALEHYRDELAGKTFCVRCRRAGKHEFTSIEVERHVGGVLNQQSEALGVNLKNPDVTVRLDIDRDRLFLVQKRYPGLGGFPLGTQDPVLSLISGGFDSTVSSFQCMKRGVNTHFLFFNLGGHAHEVGVKEVAYYLWERYGSSHPVRFVTVPFEGVVAEILEKVENSQMGVILKRMMLRAASQITTEMNIPALVTGEAIAQVSSQTLPNLAIIDRVTDTLVLRPLITMDKQQIIDISSHIGTEQFAKSMPEYCGVISRKPTTRARIEKVEAEEARFDFSVLDSAIAERHEVSIRDLAEDDKEVQEVPIVTTLEPGMVVLDIRHPDEEEAAPLEIDMGVEVKAVPFFRLNTAFNDGELSADKPYLLYCPKGVMSRLHAAHLWDQGFKKVAVYRP